MNLEQYLGSANVPIVVQVKYLVWQVVPSTPPSHAQEKELLVKFDLQTPLLLQVCPAQKLTAVAHVDPVKLALHVQAAAPAALAKQVPPFRHGLVKQTATKVWQVVPVKPLAHVQVGAALVRPFEQLPPFWHGLTRHLSILEAQVEPLKKAAHVHVNMLTPSMQVPPFRHGLEAHSLMLVLQSMPV